MLLIPCACSTPLFSEDIISSPKEINGQVHHVGELVKVNISSPDYAEKHFPNPEDYTLDNLIASGAPLNEVASPLAGEVIDAVPVADAAVQYLGDDENFRDARP